MIMNLTETNSVFEPFNNLGDKEKKAIFEVINVKVDDEMKEVINRLNQFDKDIINRFDQFELKFELKFDNIRQEMKAEILSSRNTSIIWTIATVFTASGLIIAIVSALVNLFHR